MSIRKRIGMRRYRATFWKHDGTMDDYGQPTYQNDANWDQVGGYWPCELITTVGGEIVRGRMTHEKSTHVLYGEFSGVKDTVDANHRCIIDGKKYGISCILDADGLRMEKRIELRGEN
jgi:hypothetical protein